MKNSLIQLIQSRAFAVLLGTLGFASQFTAHAAPPVVTDVTAIQQASPSKNVNISYTISDPDSTSINIYILVSKDSGATWTVPASTFSGTGVPGTNIAVTATPTAKSVVWYAGTDWDGHFTSTCRVRVLVNDAGLAFIPAGSFSRGNVIGDSDIIDAPVYSVSISAFYMDSTLITGGKWNQIVEGYAQSQGYDLPSAVQLPSTSVPGYKAANHPVYNVAWYQTAKWCNARSQMEGATPVYYTDSGFTTVYKTGQVTPFVKPGANGYRLPTEAEWEKAARGGLSGKRFPWGDTITHSQANYYSSFNYPYDAGPSQGSDPIYGVGAYPLTSPVGSFAPNGYNLYDMAGNVFEWCGDWYGSAYYASGQADPQGPNSGSSRVQRGGAWVNYANVARSASRSADTPSYANSNCGFRCVRGL